MSRCSIKSKEFKQRLYEREVEKNLQENLKKRNKITEDQERKFQEKVESLKVNWRSELFPQEEENEQIEIVEEIKVKVPERLKSNWKKELNEGMTSSGVFFQDYQATGDVNLQTIDSGSVDSFNPSFTSGVNFGSDGFSLGQNYLQFSGNPSPSNLRYADTITIDTSTYTTISFSGIAGNGSNGGSTPNGDLLVIWYDAAGSNGLLGLIPNNSSSLTKYSFTLPPEARGKNIDIFFAEIDPPEQASQYIGQSLPSLHPAVWDNVNYGWGGYGNIAANVNTLLSIQNPTLADFEDYGDRIWTLMQMKVYGLYSPSGFFWKIPGYPAPVSGNTNGTTEADRIAVGQAIYNAYGYRGDKYPLTYGIGDLGFQRRTPISVLVPLDSPEAVSFIRVGTDVKTGAPGERYKKVMQQLKASKDYTTTKFGSNFPGSNSTGIRDFTPSPIGPKAGYATWGKAAEKNAQQSASTFAKSQQVTSSSPTYQYGNQADFQRWIQSQQTPIGTQIKTPGGGTLTRVSDVGFKPQTTFTYDKVTSAGVQKVTTTIPRGAGYSQLVPSTPPKTQAPQKSLSPQQLANIDKQIKSLQAQSDKNKQDANNNRWKAAAELGLGVAGVVGGIGVAAKIPAAIKTAQTVSQVRQATKAYDTYKALEKIRDTAVKQKMFSPPKDYTAKPSPTTGSPPKGSGFWKYQR